MNGQFYSTILRALGIAICLVLASGGQHSLRAQGGRTPVAKIQIKSGQVVKVEQQAARPDGVTDEKGRVVRPRKFDRLIRESDQPTIVPRSDTPLASEAQTQETGAESDQVFAPRQPGQDAAMTIDGEPMTPDVSVDGNRAQSVPGSVDLVISDVSVLDGTGPAISFRFTIHNNGPDVVTANFQNHIYLSLNTQITTSDYYLTYFVCTTDIAGGGSRTSADLSYTVSGVPDGSYYLGVIVDGSNIVLETSEINNTNYDASPKVAITNPGTRDLDVVSVEVLDPAGPSVGYRFTLSNGGTLSVPSGFETDVYLSSNTTISSGDYLIETRTATTPLPAGATYTSPNIYRTVSGVPDGSYYLGVITDASGAVAESNEGNNTGYDASPLVSIGSTGTYDLDVISVEVLDATGPDIQYRYTVGNNGTGLITTSFQNDIYLSTNTTISPTDYKIDTRTATTDIAAGGNYTSATLSRTVSGVPDGSYYLGIIVDATGLIDETNESNNWGYDSSPQVAITTVDTYDLDVTSVEVLDAAGPNITFRYTLVNHGTGAITVTFSNDYYLSSNTTISTADYLIGTRTTASDIPAGGSHTSADLDFTVSGVPDGSYYLGVITDADGIIGESNETNNSGYDASPMVTVSASTVYDLHVVSVEAIDATGPDITYKYTIGNAGTGEVASGFENHVYLSANATISSSDYLIETWVSGQPVPASGNYTSRELSSTVTGVPDGSYYLGVITDGGADVDETNESNNTGYDSSPQVTISSSMVYDLYVSSVEVLNPVCPDIEYRYTIGNNGTDAVPMGFENRVYLSDDATIASTDHLIDTRISSNNVPAAGTYTSTSLSCTVSGLPDGTYYLGVIADAGGAVAETNEGNNSGYDNTHQLTLSPTDVEEGQESLPGSFQVLQNYPNPFNPSTTIKYTVGGAGNQGSGPSDRDSRSASGGPEPGASKIRLAVYDLLGREVAVLVDDWKQPGIYEVTFDGTGLASGVYIYRMTAGTFVQTRSMTLVK